MEYRKIRIETTDTKLVARLRSMLEKGTAFRVTDDSWRYKGVAFSGGPPLEFYILIITLAANLATIATALYTFFQEKPSPKRSLAFKFNGKKIKLDGSWSKEDIRHILSKFSKVVTESERTRVISVIDNEKRKELRDRLEELEKYIGGYGEIISGFKNMSKLEEWQKRRMREYSKKLNELKKERDKIKEVLGK